MKNFYTHHVLHSLSIAKFKKFMPGTRVLDLGTGGGFPGIPLAIIFPDCNFLLVDSINKKINVVKEISNTLKLTNVSYNAIRVEKLKIKHDFIVSRAVTRMNKFRNLVKGLISITVTIGNPFRLKNLPDKDEKIYFNNLTDEMMNIKHQKVNISDYFDEEFFETKKIVYLEN